MLGVTRPCRASMQERKQLLLTCCSSTRANGKSGRALAAQELGSFWGAEWARSNMPKGAGLRPAASHLPAVRLLLC